MKVTIHNENDMKLNKTKKAIIDYNDETVTVIVDRETSYVIGFENMLHNGSDNPSCGTLKDSSNNPVWDIDVFWDNNYHESITLRPIYIDHKGMAKSDYSGSHPITDIIVNGDRKEYINKLTNTFTREVIISCFSCGLDSSFASSESFDNMVKHIAERTYEATGTWDFSDVDVEMEVRRWVQDAIGVLYC